MGVTANLVPNQQNGNNADGANNLVVEVTDQSFNEHIKQGYTLVDFWAEWCGPCKMVAPTIHKLAEKWKGKVNFAKLDTEANIVIPSTYGIMSLPTFILFKDGQAIDGIIGNQPEQAFEQFLKKHISE